MDAHHADAALPVSVLDQRHVRASSSVRNSAGRMVARYGPILSNVRAIGQASGARLWDELLARACIGLSGPEGPPPGDVHDHDHRNPSGRPDAADAAAAGARPAACAGDVCRRGRRAPDHRPGAETAAGGRGLPDQRRSVRLRARHAGAMYRLSRRRYPAAGDDGRDVCLGRPDAVDGGSARYRPARHLRLGDRCRDLRHCCRALHQPAAAAVSTRRHRNHHPGDRHFADAGRHQLGRWRPADPDQGRSTACLAPFPIPAMASCRGSASRCSCCW